MKQRVDWIFNDEQSQADSCQTTWEKILIYLEEILKFKQTSRLL